MNLCPMVPTKDKATRARSIQARIRAKAVKFHKAASWFPDFEQELIQFPRGDHDDQCLVGETLIRMADGTEKPICKITDEDWVATPYGPCPVIDSGPTNYDAEVYRLATDEGKVLTGTAGHPVWSNGWIALAKLGNKDKILHADVSINGESSCLASTKKQQYRKRLFSTASSIAGIRNQSTSIYVAISRVAEVAASSIVIYGGCISGRFRRVATSITRTATGLTTPSTILSVCQSQSILSSTCQHSNGPSIAWNGSNILPRFDPRLLCGTLLLMVGRGIASTADVTGRIAQRLSESANNAVRYFRLRSHAQDFAHQLVRTKIGLREIRITGVEKLPTRRLVYNLTVANARCYFANGILVHNCDALAWIGLGLARMSTPVTKQEEEEFAFERERRETMTLGRSSITGY